MAMRNNPTCSRFPNLDGRVLSSRNSITCRHAIHGLCLPSPHSHDTGADTCQPGGVRSAHIYARDAAATCTHVTTAVYRSTRARLPPAAYAAPTGTRAYFLQTAPSDSV